jgi:hypothetical protein
MSIKLKPSTKEYKRDARGKIVGKKFSWRHYPPASFKTEELKEMYTNSSYKRKKHLIQIELVKRGNIDI